MKIVKEYINEKFEENSDPIKDMDIGFSTAKEYVNKRFKKAGINSDYDEFYEYELSWDLPEFITNISNIYIDMMKQQHTDTRTLDYIVSMFQSLYDRLSEEEKIKMIKPVLDRSIDYYEKYK